MDLDKPSTFQPWFTRACRWIINGNPDVERLLAYLERLQVPVLSESAETHIHRDAVRLPQHWDPSQVSRELSDAIVLTGDDSVAGVSKLIGETFGFELYRHVFQKFRGVGPEQGQRVLDEYLNPKRCARYGELRDSLIGMAQKERELQAYGQEFYPNAPQRIMALERRLPQELLRELENQMLTDYARKREFGRASCRERV